MTLQQYVRAIDIAAFTGVFSSFFLALAVISVVAELAGHDLFGLTMVLVGLSVLMGSVADRYRRKIREYEMQH